MNLANIKLDKQKKILIAIICVIIVYVDTTYILKAHQAGLKSTDAKILKLKNDLLNLDRDAANMRAAKAKQSLGIQEGNVKSTKIISENQISGLLQDISNQANKFDIKIDQIRPSRQDQDAKSAVASDKVSVLLINLDLICDYHSLGKFINSLENYLVYMAVSELKISNQLADYMKQKVNLVLKTYVAK